MAIADNLAAIQSRINAACERSGRDPSEVQLLAVSKGHPVEALEEAARAGVTLFGESKVQEAKAKAEALPGEFRFQLIGHLQRNKCKDAVGLFEKIQSVDSLRLAMEIDKRCESIQRTLPILLEVNISGEASKFGFAPDEVLNEVVEIDALPCVEVCGLMTIAPYLDDPEQVRPYFRQLRELKQRCEALLGRSLPELSMGMSGDFETAIEEGATIVRVGTLLFGERQYPAKQD